MNHEDHRRDLIRVVSACIAMAILIFLTGCAPTQWVSSALDSVRSDTEATQAAEGTASTERFWAGAATVPVTVVLLVTDTAVTETSPPQPTSEVHPTTTVPATAQPIDTALPAESPTAPIPPTNQVDQPVETPIPPTTQPAQSVTAPAGDAPIACNTVKVAYGMTYIVCVTGITVNESGQLVVKVTWTFGGIPVRATVSKKSDQDNRNMYLTDDLGNRYDHIGGGGAAYNTVQMVNAVPQPGWFVFPAPAPSAKKFSLHDDDQGLVLDGVPLSAPTRP